MPIASNFSSKNSKSVIGTILRKRTKYSLVFSCIVQLRSIALHEAHRLDSTDWFLVVQYRVYRRQSNYGATIQIVKKHEDISIVSEYADCISNV